MTNRRGFTLLEIVVVMTVGAILLSISVNAFGSVRSRYAVREARTSFAALQSRARAQAIEYAQTVEFHVDVANDSIWIERNDTTLERMRLFDQFGVNVIGSSSAYALCFNSRGYGVASGCSSFASTVTLQFANGDDTTSLQMLPLGQLIY